MILRVSTGLDTNFFKDKILKNEPKILKKYPPLNFDNEQTDGGTGLGIESLASRFFQYNLLNWRGTKSLKHAIKESYQHYFQKKVDHIYVQCWANVMRDGDQIRPHVHANKNITDRCEMLSGNLFIYCDKSTSTYYDDLEVENNNGEMILFPSYVPHCTSKYEGDNCRISIAFDIYSEKGFELGINSNVRNHWKKI